MGSGCWTVEKRSNLRNEFISREDGSVPETGCLSIIVLGASGDLAKKKTFPALFNLYRQVWKNFFQFLMDIISFSKFHFQNGLYSMELHQYVDFMEGCTVCRAFCYPMKSIYLDMQGRRFQMTS